MVTEVGGLYGAAGAGTQPLDVTWPVQGTCLDASSFPFSPDCSGGGGDDAPEVGSLPVLPGGGLLAASFGAPPGAVGCCCGVGVALAT